MVDVLWTGGLLWLASLGGSRDSEGRRSSVDIDGIGIFGSGFLVVIVGGMTGTDMLKAGGLGTIGFPGWLVGVSTGTAGGLILTGTNGRLFLGWPGGSGLLVLVCTNEVTTETC